MITGRNVELMSFDAKAFASTLKTKARMVFSSQKRAAAQKYLWAKKYYMVMNIA